MGERVEDITRHIIYASEKTPRGGPRRAESPTMEKTSMRSERLLTSLLVAVSLLLSAGLAAQSPQGTPTPTAEDDKAADKTADKGKSSKSGDQKPPKEEKPSFTHHEIRIGGTPVKYTATAGYMAMKDETAKLKATIFSMAYTRDGAAANRRPVTFTFNGGPGSSSVWLHLGAIGPNRVVMGDAGQPL